MLQLVAGLVATMTVCQARATANVSHPAGFLSRAKRQLRGEGGMPPRIPTCPPNYIDQTNGAAYWWDCAKNCPGLWPWSDAHCGCACVLPNQYRAIMAVRATKKNEAAAVAAAAAVASAKATAPTAGAAGFVASNTYVAPPATVPAPASKSKTPSPAAAAHAAVIAAAAAAPSPATPVSLGPAARAQAGNPVVPVVAPQATSQRSAGGASSVAQRSRPSLVATGQNSTGAGDGDGANPGLSSLAIALISVGVTIVVASCVLAASVYIQICNSPADMPLEKHTMVVRIVLRLTAPPKSKLSRVEPIEPALNSPTVQRTDDLPDSSQKSSHPVLLACPPEQHYAMQKIQPVAQLILCPDVSIVSRRQKERVMNGGWTSGLSGLNTPPPRPSNGSTATRTPRPSDGSTPARTPRPSNGSTPARTPRPSNGSTPNRTPRPNQGGTLSWTPRPSPGSTPSRTPRPSNGSTPNRTPRPSNGTTRSASLPPGSARSAKPLPPTIKSDANACSLSIVSSSARIEPQPPEP